MRNMNFLWIVNLTIYDLDLIVLILQLSLSVLEHYVLFFFSSLKDFSTGLLKVINYRIFPCNSKQIKLSFLDIAPSIPKHIIFLGEWECDKQDKNQKLWESTENTHGKGSRAISVNHHAVRRREETHRDD